MKKQIINFTKVQISKVVLFFLAKGIRTLYKNDSIVKHEINGWKDNFIVEITTIEGKIHWCIQKQGNTIKRVQTQNPDLTICFKTSDVLFKLTTGRLGVARAYAEHRFILKGDISAAMSFVRVIDRTEGYLFPAIITKNILKEVPKREKNILEIYGRLLLNQ